MGLEDFYQRTKDGFHSLIDCVPYVATLREENDSLRHDRDRYRVKYTLSQKAVEELEEQYGALEQHSLKQQQEMGFLEKQLALQHGLVAFRNKEKKDLKELVSTMMTHYGKLIKDLVMQSPWNKLPGALLDHEGRIVYVTPPMKKLLLKDDSNVEGHYHLDYFGVQEDHKERFKSFYQDPAQDDVEVVSLISDGTKVKPIGIRFHKLSTSQLDLGSISSTSSDITLPVLTYVSAKKSRLTLKHYIDRVRGHRNRQERAWEQRHGFAQD